MNKWLVVGAVSAFLLVGCAVSPYRQAETYISQKEYKQALQIYLRALNPHVRNGKRYIAYEPEAMTGIGAVLWHLKRYETAAKVLSQVAKRNPRYGKALFYLGASYEALKQISKADDVYRRYALLDETDPYRDVLRWRSDWVSKQTLAQDMRKSMAVQSNVAALPQGTVAVLYFQNLAKNSWSALQKGIAQLIIDDLSNLDQIKVVERERVQQLILATGWTPRDISQDDRNADIGKSLGAGVLVKGSYRVAKGQAIEFNVGTVRLAAGRPFQPNKFQGRLQQLLSLEKRMVMKIVADLGIALTPEQERLLMSAATQSFEAFTYFCYGLNDMDAGKFESAQARFAKAVKLDPDFFLAQDQIVDPFLFSATHNPQVAAMGESVEAFMTGRPEIPGVAGAGAQAYAVTPVNRLQEFGYWMDAGFIPSGDSRDAGDLYVEGELPPVGPQILPGAPNPPYTPGRWILPGPPNPPSRH